MGGGEGEAPMLLPTSSKRFKSNQKKRKTTINDFKGFFSYKPSKEFSW